MNLRILHLVIFSALILLFPNTVNAQACLENGITFSRQGQIDSFELNYPGCTLIEGDVIIQEEQDSTIFNLHGLSVLTELGYSLFIEDNKALDGPEWVGEYHIHLQPNSYQKEYDMLSSLNGLNGFATLNLICG